MIEKETAVKDKRNKRTSNDRYDNDIHKKTNTKK